MDVTNLGTTCRLLSADCTMKMQTESPPATYMNNNTQCTRINNIRVISVGWLFVLDPNF